MDGYEQFLIDLKDCKKVEKDIFKFPRINAFERIIHERNKMIQEELQTESIKIDIQQGKYKPFPLYEFTDIS